jgi:hypothetical protein
MPDYLQQQRLKGSILTRTYKVQSLGEGRLQAARDEVCGERKGWLNTIEAHQHLRHWQQTQVRHGSTQLASIMLCAAHIWRHDIAN